MKKVEIIMSTYNGQDYIEEQIESLLNQTYQNIRVIIRDDGSTDNTLQILSKYENNLKIKIEKCGNVGVVKSFFELLKLTSDESDYIAFCDQDDVWKPDKIAKAVKYLEKESQHYPLLYCSRLSFVDSDLNEIKLSPLPKKPLELGNSLVENIATGCTCVINKEMKRAMTNINTEDIIMHDWWSYLIASSFGKVVYESAPTIYYRQHSNNVVGASTTIIGKWNKRFKGFKKNYRKNKLQKQANKFIEVYDDFLNEEQKIIISNFINIPQGFLEKIYYVIKTPLYRQKTEDNIILKIVMLFNLM